MGILGSSWLPEGYYEDDGYGFTKVDDPQRIKELFRAGKLYEHDGMSMGLVDDKLIINIKKNKYQDEQINRKA